MNGELAPLNIRQVGLRRQALAPTRRVGVGRRLEEGEKVDLVDTLITKAEEIRLSILKPFPVTMVEDSWVKLNNFLIDVTPSIPVLPKM